MSESHRARPPKAAAGKSAGKAPTDAFAEFLNPNSMITPGAAGAITMVITNTLCQQFAQLPLNYTGLAVSFMFGTMVFGYGARLMSRIGYFIVNSLIIFVVAAGSSAVGAHIAKEPSVKTAALQAVPANGKAKGFGLASADPPAAPDKPPPDNPPPEKPKFFRNWL